MDSTLLDPLLTVLTVPFILLPLDLPRECDTMGQHHQHVDFAIF